MTIQLLEAILKLRDELSGPLGIAARNVEKFAKDNQQSFTAVAQAGGIIAGAVVAAGAAIYELGQRGAVVGDVARNFDYLTKGAGESADVMLGKLRQGTAGTISDFELMKIANKAIGDGLKLTADDAGTMAAAARELGKRVGVDTKEAFEELSESMATGKVKGLAHLGMMVDQTKAVYDYQVAHGKLGVQLTDTEHRAAIQAATMKALGNVVKDAGDQDKDFGEKIDALKVKFANFIDQLSILVNDSPVLAAGLDAVTKAIDEAFGGNTAGALQFVMSLINQFAIGVVTAGQVAVEVARFISDAWNGLKVIFSAVMAATLEPLRLVIDGIELLAEKATLIPGVGPKIAAMLPSLRDLKNGIDGVTDSFASDAVAAVDDAAAQNHSLDQVGEALGKVKSAMVAASQQQAAASKAAATHTKTVKDNGGAIGENIKFTEMYGAAIKDLTLALIADLSPLDQSLIKLGLDTEAKKAAIDISLKKKEINAQEAQSLRDVADATAAVIGVELIRADAEATELAGMDALDAANLAYIEKLNEIHPTLERTLEIMQMKHVADVQQVVDDLRKKGVGEEYIASVVKQMEKTEALTEKQMLQHRAMEDLNTIFNNSKEVLGLLGVSADSTFMKLVDGAQKAITVAKDLKGIYNSFGDIISVVTKLFGAHIAGATGAATATGAQAVATTGAAAATTGLATAEGAATAASGGLIAGLGAVAAAAAAAALVILPFIALFKIFGGNHAIDTSTPEGYKEVQDYLKDHPGGNFDDANQLPNQTADDYKNQYGHPPTTHAAQGMSEWLTSPRWILAGEGGEPEHVQITPKSKMGAGGGGAATDAHFKRLGDRLEAQQAQLPGMIARAVRDAMLRTH